MFAEVRFFIELSAAQGQKIPAAVILPYGPLIEDLYNDSYGALEACYARPRDQQLHVVPLASIVSVVGIFELPKGPAGSIFAGEKIGHDSEWIFGNDDGEASV
jgi:hypothetical protein